MTRRWTLTLVAVLGPTFAATPPAMEPHTPSGSLLPRPAMPSFESLDRNQDGVLVRAEVPPSWRWRAASTTTTSTATRA